MKKLAIPLAILLFLLLGTTAVVFYGRGYRFWLEQGRPDFSGTGLLVATSTPDGAQVFVNGHLTTATDNTINLTPGEYDVKIFKEGYFAWQKKIKIQKEVVSKAEALLFPTAPKLESITAVGVQNPVIDPSQTRIAYTIASQSARKNGIYVFDMTTRTMLTLQSASIQIADDTTDIFSQSSISWSPDGKNLLAAITSTSRPTTATYLLDSTTMNDAPQDITATLANTTEAWEKDKSEKALARLAAFKPALSSLITENFNIISWSLDETKILYQASTSATLPIVITPRLIGTNSTPEERSIQKNSIYAYDIKEDRNYKLDISNSKLEIKNFQGSQPLAWLPDSSHLLYVHDKKIDIMEYDGTNSTTVYAGPFMDNYAFPWPNASKILILTNLGNPSISPNLYTVGLK